MSALTMLSTECVNEWCGECRIRSCACDCHLSGVAARPRSPRPRPRHSASRERVLSALIAFHAAHGIAPTTRELAAQVGLGVGTVNHHIKRLDAEGRVTFKPGCPRTVRPVEVNP